MQKLKLIKKTDGWYNLYNGEIGIGSTHKELQGYKLSKQNCDEIFGVIDVEKLAELDHRIGLEEYIPTPATHIQSFKSGFNKAMELNKDKVFTLEDIRKAYYVGYEDGKSGATFFQQLIQSLNQPKEIEVMIVMEEPLVAKARQIHGEYVTGWLLESAIFPKPKLDSSGCIILKRVV